MIDVLDLAGIERQRTVVRLSWQIVAPGAGDFGQIRVSDRLQPAGNGVRRLRTIPLRRLVGHVGVEQVQPEQEGTIEVTVTQPVPALGHDDVGGLLGRVRLENDVEAALQPRAVPEKPCGSRDRRGLIARLVEALGKQGEALGQGDLIVQGAVVAGDTRT